ncbi:MAG: acyltransferase [Cyanothece sp. SIO1E1]|nr:acyltransferase [Cyanothece sp. SIO1E1]
MEIHDNVHIGDNAFLSGRGGIKIGENTHISNNFVVYSSNHNYQASCLPYDDTHTLKPVVIGRNVWIGTNVVIVPGTQIGEGSIIGAGTVVNKNVPPFAIVGSQPIQIIKYRDCEHYEKLDAKRLYGGISGKLLER